MIQATFLVCGFVVVFFLIISLSVTFDRVLFFFMGLHRLNACGCGVKWMNSDVLILDACFLLS